MRLIASNYKDLIDWSASAPLDAEVFTATSKFDAMNRPIESTSPDGSVTRRSFNEANLLERVDVNLEGAVMATQFVTNVDYDAKGQRTRIDYGNKASTTYEYDPFTFRLTRLVTHRAATAFPGDGADPPPVGWLGKPAQNLSYTYDAVGNVTSDPATTPSRRSTSAIRKSSRDAEYTYDAVYRLIEATGREHLASAGGDAIQPDAYDTSHMGFGHPGDGNLMGTYREQYAYDFAGNILEMKHRGEQRLCCRVGRGAIPTTSRA